MNRSLPWLGLALFLWGIGEGMFIQLQPIYLQQLGADPVQIGLILGAFGLTMTLTHIPAGHLADRIGRRPLLIAAWSVGLFSTVGMAAAPSLPYFLIGLLGYGLTAFVASPLDSYTTAARGKWSVARAMSFVSVSFNGGAVIGPLIGGHLAEAYGFRTVYGLAAGVFVVSTAAVFLIKAQPKDHHEAGLLQASLLSNRPLLGFLAVFFFVAFGAYLPQPLTPNFLETYQHLSISQVGTLISIGYLGITLLQLVLGQLEARTGFILAQVSLSIWFFILWKASGFEWFAWGYIFYGGFRVLRSLGVAQVRGFVHGSQMGLAYGVAEMLGSATIFLAPPIAGLLYSADPWLMYPIGLVLLLTGIILTLTFIPRTRVLPQDRIELAPDL